MTSHFAQQNRRRFGLAHTLRCLWKGQTLMRIRMDVGLASETLRGKVVDIGGGRHPDYFNFFQIEDGIQIEAVDGSISGINFEHDALPFAANSVDTIVMCNVLEHIYNYRFLLGECARILQSEGQLIGFVPFWVGYHPDPNDYFRYTKEALLKIFSDVGFADINIRVVGDGPVLASFNTIVLSVPRVVRPLLYIVHAPIDQLFTKLRPRSRERNPLGFIFVVSKSART